MVMVEGGARVGMRLLGRASGRVAHGAALAGLVDRHLHAGRLTLGLEMAVAAASTPIAPDARDRLDALRGVLLALTGRTEDGLTVLAEADDPVGRGHALATIRACRAEAALWGGLPRQAIEQATDVLDRDGEPDDQVRALLARAWAEVELDRAPTPLRLRTTIEPGSRAWASALAELRGIEALSRGAHRGAAVAFDEAAGRWAGWHAPRALVCRWAAGEARRRAGDTDAVAPLRATLDAAAAMEFEPLAARVRRSLRLAGDRPVQQRFPPTLDRVTARERQVLQLVGRGRTNDEIARRMGLGRPTVARLLSNARVKLGAESRAHAVVIHGCAGSGEEAGRDAEVHGPDNRPAIDDDARAILARIATGRTLGAIARELGLSRRTADRRLADARAALGVERTTEAVARAQRFGWLA